MLLSATGRPPVLHPAEIHIPVKSKLLLMQRLSAAGMPVPPTRFCRSVEEIATEMRQTGGPMVVKPAYGHGGHDVERLEGDPEAYRGTLQRLLDLHGGLLLQPYLEHPQGDVRATVIGDEVALSFRRIPPAGGWKTNIAAGGRAEVCTPSPAVRQLALDAASALKLTIAGLDIVDYGDRQIIFEANTSPGWYMLRSEEQEMVAEKCINHAIQYAMRARAAAA
jgi:ribosomal protein S6--L-glutamate ligase